MKRRIATGAVALSIVAGVGVGYAIEQMNSGSATARTPQPSVAATATASPTRGLDTATGLVAPGEFGQVEAGMTIADAVNTGYIEPDPDRSDVCEGDFYRWTDSPITSGLDVVTTDDTIASLGMREPTLETADGLMVGSTAADVRAVYGDQLIEVTSDYGQPGVLVKEGDRWLGFLYGEVTPDTLTDDAQVTFVEVSRGDRPGLLRDGC